MVNARFHKIHIKWNTILMIIFKNKKKKQFYELSRLIMVSMPILLIILLINWLSVRLNAQLKWLAMQVVLHTPYGTRTKIADNVVGTRRQDGNSIMELIKYPNNQKCKFGIFYIVLRKHFGYEFRFGRWNDGQCIKEIAQTIT